MTRALGALAALLLTPVIAHGQASFEMQVQPSIESLADAGADGQLRGAVFGDAAAEYEFAGRRGRVFYGLDAGTFATPGDWSYFRHNAGLVYRLGGERRRVYLGASGTLRRNGEAWSAADYQGAQVMANVELGSSATTNWRFGYRLDGRRFADLPELDQLEQDAFASLLVSLPTRTTLLGEVHLGGKWYEGAATATSASSPAAPTPVGSVEGRRGRGMGPQVRGAEFSARLESASRAGQVTWMVRVAQSLTDRTGLSVQVSGRSAFGSVPPALVTTPPAFFDDGVYDDPFASDALAVRATLKHVFEQGPVLEASGSWLRKDYVATLALAATGLPVSVDGLRSDRVWRARAGASIPLWPTRTGGRSMALDLSCFFLDHASNDAFYNYSSRGVMMGVSLEY